MSSRAGTCTLTLPMGDIGIPKGFLTSMLNSHLYKAFCIHLIWFVKCETFRLFTKWYLRNSKFNIPLLLMSRLKRSVWKNGLSTSQEVNVLLSRTFHCSAVSFAYLSLLFAACFPQSNFSCLYALLIFIMHSIHRYQRKSSCPLSFRSPFSGMITAPRIIQCTTVIRRPAAGAVPWTRTASGSPGIRNASPCLVGLVGASWCMFV